MTTAINILEAALAEQSHPLNWGSIHLRCAIRYLRAQENNETYSGWFFSPKNYA